MWALTHAESRPLAEMMIRTSNSRVMVQFFARKQQQPNGIVRWSKVAIDQRSQMTGDCLFVKSVD